MKKLLTEAMHEIRNLRRANEILRAKVEVMDLFACVLHTTAAHRSEGAAIDIAWKIEREIDAINASKEKDNAHKGHLGERVEEGQSAGNGG